MKWINQFENQDDDNINETIHINDNDSTSEKMSMKLPKLMKMVQPITKMDDNDNN